MTMAAERDFALVTDALAAIFSARDDEEGVVEMARLKERSAYRAPELSREDWVALLRYLGMASKAGRLPNPKAPDAPVWARWMSDVVEARVLLVRP